ncbi:Edn3 [Phodopus roborovskii]|uniref:Endothelin-3 n=1 Tax=Phodopus roborovskii TaxID=109678 RepID=A0AAU9YMW0_PHORO|nr:Edn3 [Phodopus roborovskii]
MEPGLWLLLGLTVTSAAGRFALQCLNRFPSCFSMLCRQIVPYGLSNFRGSLRGKRSSGPFPENSQPSPRTRLRCACMGTDDKACEHFCAHATDVNSDSRGAGRPAAEERGDQRVKSRTEKACWP